MSTNASSFTGRVSNYGLRVWLAVLGIAAAVFVANFLYASYLSNQENEARALTAELQVLSQQLAKYSREAVEGGNAESIEEFKVSSANNNAEIMQVTDITTTSKSGNNQLRGTAFWFINDSALSSVNRFAPKDAAGKAIKPDIRTNSFGASGGGPLIKNRTFFFGTYEGVREPCSSTCAPSLTSATSRSPSAGTGST